jgi:predicted O-methyltransferase YrrM
MTTLSPDREHPATGPTATAEIGLDLVRQLYRWHADDLRAAWRAQHDLRRRLPEMKTQLDDIEAEITYLLLRYFRPGHVVEIGSLHGWSTSWILRALHDNDNGRLTTLDLIDNATGNVPAALGEGRWEFRKGDARAHAPDWLSGLDYLFIDAAHSGGFARWYLSGIFPGLPPRTPVSVHDVFHRRKPLPLTEGRGILRWLDRSGLAYFTAAPAKRAVTYHELVALRQALGIEGFPQNGCDNPMLWFLIGGGS